MPSLFSFYDVAVAEKDAITDRRAALARKDDPKADVAPWTVRVEPMTDGGRPVKDERGDPFPKLTSDRSLVGLALSGGGIRSASFCLGVLQGLDAVIPDDRKPQMLDAVDYLSTVSGGGYLGASLVAGTRQNKGRFPFTSKLDQLETVGTQHLRDYSNFLAPGGWLDWAAGAVAVARGLLINAFLVFGVILPLAAATAALFPDEDRLRGPGLGAALDHYGPSARSSLAAAVLGLCAAAVLLSASARERPPRNRPNTLATRERAGTLSAVAALGLVAVAVVAVQPSVLRGLFDAAHLSLCPTFGDGAGWLGRSLNGIGLGAGGPWASLLAVTTALWAFGGKLVKVAQATFGDRSWSGFLAHWGSRVAIAVGAAAVPLALWAAYLSASFAAIAWRPWAGAAACCLHPGPPASPGWLAALGLTQGELPLVYLIVGLLFAVLATLTPPNANSLHGYYRDRLSRAFLWTVDTLKEEAELRNRRPPGVAETLFGLRPGQREKIEPADGLKLSSLDSPVTGTTTVPWPTPYLLINAAVNLEGSRYANRRGRNADAFIFSPRHVGSAATGYVSTSEMEAADPHLDLATAMAISGAAASANMGASTIKPLTFSLALLNVRLGYWLPNPRRLPRSAEPAPTANGPANGPVPEPPRPAAMLWPVSFAMEALGLLDEWSSLVYLTDGGHFDNLGLYELLRRRCRVVIVADAEADLPMNFGSLVRLERYARIDLGVRIDLPWEELRRWSRKITVDDPHGPDGDTKACIGPHVALGRIEYGDEEPGLLIYIKSCITGDENDLIRDYRRRHPDFPHETTLDQFFTEEQFEVYRALGFHAAKSFFLGQDRFGFSPSHVDATWTATLKKALARLNVPQDAADRIVAHQTPKPVPTAAARRRWAWL